MTTTKNKYVLTEEHKAQLEPWEKKWRANAMSTKAMTDEDRRLCREAVAGLYKAAGKEPPLVVFVPSPFVGAFAAGFAASIWHRRKTGDRTIAATYAATYAATDAATRAATYAATYDATDAATYDATYASDLSKWYVIHGDMRACASALGVDDFGFSCASMSYRFWQGGNQWSGYDGFLSFFRHIAKLEIDYSKWAHWETLSKHSGPRWVHEKFCIISDRPAVLKVDEQNRPHAENGPFCQWRDGSALYSWHGSRVPAEWIERKEKLDPATALTHENVELRRAAAEIIGWTKVLNHLSPRVVNADKDPEIGTLLEVDLPDSPKSKFLQVKCGTGRDFVLPVPAEMKTARQANAWTYSLEPEQLKVEVRT